jgi:hypothetical protein
MATLTRRFAIVAGLAVVGLGLLSSEASAQFRVRRVGATPVPFKQPINRNWLVAPGVTLRQAAYNTRVVGRALSSIPPWVYGYNPYPSPFINYGNPYPFYYGYNPYALYSSVYNPYLTGAAYSPYNPYGLYGYSYLYQ